MSRTPQDAFSNFQPRRPRPRPYRPSGALPQGLRSGDPLRSAHSSMARAPRPAPGPKRPPGPATFVPKQPVTEGQRRRMIKAAAWRLARLLRVRPADLVVEKDLAVRYQTAFPKPIRGDKHGQAARLIAKMMRLRKAAEA